LGSPNLVLELQLRALSKSITSANQQSQKTRSIDPRTEQGKRALNNWVQAVQSLRQHKPSDKVLYSKRMPDIEQLMEAWPEDSRMESLLNELTAAMAKGPSALSDGTEPAAPTTPFSMANLHLSIKDLSKVVCVVLDIPVYSSPADPTSSSPRHLIESLHTLFTLYGGFKNNQHFGNDLLPEAARPPPEKSSAPSPLFGYAQE
jgi:intraflagellar transport protein 46